jgi:hypothetical protein
MAKQGAQAMGEPPDPEAGSCAEDPRAEGHTPAQAPVAVMGGGPHSVGPGAYMSAAQYHQLESGAMHYDPEAAAAAPHHYGLSEGGYQQTEAYLTAAAAAVAAATGQEYSAAYAAAHYAAVAAAAQAHPHQQLGSHGDGGEVRLEMGGAGEGATYMGHGGGYGGHQEPPQC